MLPKNNPRKNGMDMFSPAKTAVRIRPGRFRACWADNEEDIEYYPDFTKDDLSHVFFPEENYFLDETGNPVFYLQPGVAAPETVGLLTFSISLEDILDEL